MYICTGGLNLKVMWCFGEIQTYRRQWERERELESSPHPPRRLPSLPKLDRGTRASSAFTSPVAVVPCQLSVNVAPPLLAAGPRPDVNESLPFFVVLERDYMAAAFLLPLLLLLPFRPVDVGE